MIQIPERLIDAQILNTKIHKCRLHFCFSLINSYPDQLPTHYHEAMPIETMIDE